MKVTLAVVQIYDLRIRSVIAEDDIQIAITVDVDQPTGIRAIRGLAEIVSGQNVTPAVAQENPALQWPMPSLNEQNVETVIAIQITDAHVGRGLGSRLEKKDSIVTREDR